MKMVMIAYNSAIDEELREVLAKHGIENYTKWTRTFGKGTTSGPHMGTDVWPGENTVLFIAIEDEKVNAVLSDVKVLRENLGKAGVKAFAWPLEEVT